MLIVLAVIGILATVALPSFKSLTQSQQVKNAGFELYASLNLARSEAIKRNSDVTVSPASAGNWQSGWTVSASGVPSLDSQGAIAGVVISEAPASVTYTGSGRVTSTSPLFQIDVSTTPTEHVRCLKIELNGMPRALKGACP
jgi:type IV fimbrial biogenesis protein FimT